MRSSHSDLRLLCLILAPLAACSEDATIAPRIDPVPAIGVTDLPTHVPGDYEWDGDSDLVFQQDRTAFLKFALTDQLQPYAEHTDVPDPYGPTAANWRVAVSADLDGNERPDVVFQNRDSARIVAWHVVDLARVGARFTVPDGPGDLDERLICSAYFNNDHQADLVFQNTRTRRITVWVMDPAQPWVRASLHEIGEDVANFELNNFRLAGCGDFSGEGLADLVLRGPAGNVTIAYVENFRAFEKHIITEPKRDWNWTLGCVGDLDEDGHLELVWQHDDSASPVDFAVEAWKLEYSDYVRTVPLFPSGPRTAQPWRLVGPR